MIDVAIAFLRGCFKQRRNVNIEDDYEPWIEQYTAKIGDKFGIVASSHGNIIALKMITNILQRENVKQIFHLGDIMDEHAGYIECLDYVLSNPLYKSIVGNHDLLIINQDKVHNYEQEYLKLASEAFQRFKEFKTLYEKLIKLPAMIETPFFSLVHESVQYPYYAKITKLKKKSSDLGKTPDENLEAVFYSTLSQPYFTGSDHQAYIIASSKLKKEFIKPDETINVKGAKIISIPSISLSKDSNYTHGYCIAQIEEDKSISITFKDLPDMLIINTNTL